MIEKRRRSNHSDADQLNISSDDEFKKSTYRFSAGFFASCIVIIIFLYYISKYDILATMSSPSTYHANIEIPATQPANVYNMEQNEQTKMEWRKPTIEIVDEVNIKPIEATQSNSALVKPSISDDSVSNEVALLDDVMTHIDKIRSMKFVEHIVLEKSIEAKTEISILQDKLRSLLHRQYGTIEPYLVEMRLQFPSSMEQPGLPQEQSILIELAPTALVPYSVYYFLELVKKFKSGSFHRNAGHVLQAMVALNTSELQNKQQQLRGGKKLKASITRGLAFQEYHPNYPHKQYTLGYAGRPGGPEFYISTVDNVRNHGPGSQGSATEADSCFGRIYHHSNSNTTTTTTSNGKDASSSSDSIAVVKRMQQQPGKSKPSGFISDAKNYIKILSLTVLRPPRSS